MGLIPPAVFFFKGITRAPRKSCRGLSVPLAMLLASVVIKLVNAPLCLRM